jgi:hypothetical protein
LLTQAYEHGLGRAQHAAPLVGGSAGQAGGGPSQHCHIWVVPTQVQV